MDSNLEIKILKDAIDNLCGELGALTTKFEDQLKPEISEYLRVMVSEARDLIKSEKS